jgi:perosamine synthetase
MSDRLALDGGTAVVAEGSVQAWPPLTDADREAVLAVFDSGHLHNTNAPRCLELEEKWAAYTGATHALSCWGGTAALHISLAAAGVGPGDEVITAAFSFWSSAAAILHNNGVPVFADIDPRTYTLDPALIEERITPHTKAILPVHINGMPADMDPIMEVARKHGIPVVEDACQAHGATYKGRKTGSLGDIAGFSCNRSKCLSGGEGGLVTTSDESLRRRAHRHRAEFGEIILEGDVPAGAYGLGWNYRPHEFINAFILSQLTRLDEYNGLRREYADFLTAGLAEIPGFRGPFTPEGVEPCYFTYVVEFCPEELGLDIGAPEWREAARNALAHEGVGLGAFAGAPLPAHDVFAHRVGYGKGCPWTCPFGSGEVSYDVAEYPKAAAFIDAHLNLGGVYPPNDMNLMRQYLDGFRKVSENAARVVELAKG